MKKANWKGWKTVKEGTTGQIRPTKANWACYEPPHSWYLICELRRHAEPNPLKAKWSVPKKAWPWHRLRVAMCLIRFPFSDRDIWSVNRAVWFSDKINGISFSAIVFLSWYIWSDVHTITSAERPLWIGRMRTNARVQLCKLGPLPSHWVNRASSRLCLPSRQAKHGWAPGIQALG